MPEPIAQASHTDEKAQNPATGSSTIGSPAPSLASVKWIAGTKFDAGDQSTPYVVEFWATWAGENLGELDRLSQAFPGIRFLSVAVGDFEDSVRGYLEALGQPVRHAIGAESQAEGSSATNTGSPPRPGHVAREWLEAFGERGLPISFLVDAAGIVRWIGPAHELARVIPGFLTGKLTADPMSHRRRQILQTLEIDPGAAVDESPFASLFALRPPVPATSQVEWLPPPAASSAPAITPCPAGAKSGGFLGRVFGRSKTEAAVSPTEQPKPLADRSGPPRPGHAVALVLADVIMDRSLEPGWNVLNAPELNELPAEFPDVDFAVLIRTQEPLKTLFEGDYADALSRWTNEIGWRLGSETTSQEPQAFGSSSGQSIFEFFADRVHLLSMPAAALIDPAGTLVWAGSPLRLPQALEAWKNQSLTPRHASADLVYWYRLLSSNAANERLAGVAGVRSSADTNLQGFPADAFETERWEEIIESLKAQLPWRGHLWSVFEFALATREARKPGDSPEPKPSIPNLFTELTERFAAEFESMDLERFADYDYDPLDPWRLALLTAVDYLGLLREGVEPLEGADLFAIETHPLTQAVIDSAERLDACLAAVPEATIYQPSILPVLKLRLGHKTEAKKGFEAEETRFERFLEAVRDAGGAEAAERAFGQDPEKYRSVIRNLKTLCG
ncbi:hypothetical protein GC170_21000 [bacterium]|nr:hypothetical protein [bacterium]